AGGDRVAFVHQRDGVEIVVGVDQDADVGFVLHRDPGRKREGGRVDARRYERLGTHVWLADGYKAHALGRHTAGREDSSREGVVLAARSGDGERLAGQLRHRRDAAPGDDHEEVASAGRVDGPHT